jgi:hypothetical protein
LKKSPKSRSSQLKPGFCRSVHLLSVLAGQVKGGALMNCTTGVLVISTSDVPGEETGVELTVAVEPAAKAKNGTNVFMLKRCCWSD